MGNVVTEQPQKKLQGNPDTIERNDRPMEVQSDQHFIKPEESGGLMEVRVTARTHYSSPPDPNADHIADRSPRSRKPKQSTVPNEPASSHRPHCAQADRRKLGFVDPELDG